ncbi:7TM diverse intracellular signaling domain-containing protein [Pedobacter sp. JY14-1]|uniref:sensor histidine kinase n=1 Tax=Pedobacter sp. JY14-1 TaxID=3034151 RepID=UPI0023E0A22D|nr:7TM diverse intracellular signaling domain-containing protein [Pedobacter sp. JY14-1]
MIKRVCFSLPLILSLLWGMTAFAQHPIILKQGEVLNNFGTQMLLLTDSAGVLDISQIKNSDGFEKVTDNVPNLGITTYTYWLKIKVENQTNDPNLILQIPLPTLDFVDFYQVDPSGKVLYSEFIGDNRPYYNRKFDNPFSTFRFSVAKGEATTLYLRIKGNEQLQVPTTLCQSKLIAQKNADAFLVFGIFSGIFLVMFTYNLFLYLSTKDKTYLFYIINLLFIGLLQANFQGFPFKYLWPDNVWVAKYAVYILTPLAALTGLEFMKNFLHTKELLPKAHKYSRLFYLLYLFAFIQLLLGRLNTSYQLLQMAAMTVAIFMLITAIITYRKGYSPAKFFLIAWSVFLLGLCIFVLKDYNILPYNTITYSMMPFGSALEVILLSFALADKINTFKKEKEASQEEALRISLENERLITEQNIELEKKVNERTLELQKSNDTLEVALKDLKEAQSQLVDQEKMAGLGQLTAGIAHEINNPINFVTSNIKPLELDILDLDEVINMYEKLDLSGDVKEQIEKIDSFKRQIDIHFVRDEIKSLLTGISEGAKRTAEIIKSLKNFSRLDENDTKPVDLNEGLESTLVLVKNTFPDNLLVVREFGKLPNVECLPGKINQVFMNLITNAVQAIKSKPVQNAEERLTIRTWQEGENVKISIKDSGTGMPDSVKQRIFEPFFTTKDVGEGTGLGLSIVFRIIENHHGNIDVVTKVNEGTEFIVTLPVNFK